MGRLFWKGDVLRCDHDLRVPPDLRGTISERSMVCLQAMTKTGETLSRKVYLLHKQSVDIEKYRVRDPRHSLLYGLGQLHPVA